MIKKLTGEELYCYKGYDPDVFYIAGIAEEEIMKNHILVMKDKINEIIKTLNLLSKAKKKC